MSLPPRKTPPSATTTKVMKAIKSKGNKTTEVKLANLLRLNRLNGWRRGSKLPGRPDFIYPKHKLAVFVDGCFWHGCNTCFKLPATNREYWLAKIRNNKARDKRVTREISKVGWESLRIWEHQLEKRPNWVLRKIREKLSN